MGQFKGWERISDGHFSADLGGIGTIEVVREHESGRWIAAGFGSSQSILATETKAKFIAMRRARDQIEIALYRLDELKPSSEAQNVALARDVKAPYDRPVDTAYSWSSWLRVRRWCTTSLKSAPTTHASATATATART
jgi:hypothetical protein